MEVVTVEVVGDVLRELEGCKKGSFLTLNTDFLRKKVLLNKLENVYFKLFR
ncbi:hypothetical protein STRIC_0382 [Streptococcus ictaluri 707-05]|uniref:Uncharacterized protein n=1 Tax=Streptococcus ictaluri 707-05 TaxID=764299 RepID=G5K5P6_9STRE|nr:hypothetical protein STRIC_0382 [Streptococcus ictaluri 707-05]